MDQQTFISALRAVARQPQPADGMERVEEQTRKYLQPEITALEEAAKEALRAIGTEAKKNVRGEDWNLIEEYIERCLQKFQSVFELPLRSE